MTIQETDASENTSGAGWFETGRSDDPVLPEPRDEASGRHRAPAEPDETGDDGPSEDEPRAPQPRRPAEPSDVEAHPGEPDDDPRTADVPTARPAARPPFPTGSFPTGGFPTGGFPAGRFPTGGFPGGHSGGGFPAGGRPGPTGSFPAAGPGTFPPARRPHPTGPQPAVGYGRFDQPSYPRVPAATGYAEADLDDDPRPAGNAAAVTSCVLGLLGLLLSLRPLVFGSNAMTVDTYVAIAISVIALVLGIAGVRLPRRRAAGVVGIAGSLIALLMVAIIPTL